MLEEESPLENGTAGQSDIYDVDDETGIYSICAQEKIFRQFVERKLHQESFGKVLELISGCLAFASSVSFVALQYIEKEPAYFHDIFNKLDYAACSVFLFIFILKGYVATHRLQYVLSLQSVLDLFIMLPTLILVQPNDRSQSYFLIPFSRYLRAMNFVIILSRYFKLGQTDVDRQINIVFMTFQCS